MPRGSDYDERNKELLSVYKKIMRTQDVTHAEACKLAVNSPASRWYVGFSYVYRELLRRKKGRSLKDDPIFRHIRKHHPARERVYEHLWARFCELSRKREFELCSTLFLASFVLNEQAPNFVVSPSVGKAIIERELRKARAERKAKMMHKDDGDKE
jgi:hypothetical protein